MLCSIWYEDTAWASNPIQYIPYRTVQALWAVPQGAPETDGILRGRGGQLRHLCRDLHAQAREPSQVSPGEGGGNEAEVRAQVKHDIFFMWVVDANQLVKADAHL